MSEQNPVSPWPEWKLKRMIGEGSSGIVWLAERENPPAKAAMKIIRVPAEENLIPRLRAEGFDDTQIRHQIDEMTRIRQEEIENMRRFHGAANLVQIRDYSVCPEKDGLSSVLWIRMELLKSLNHYLADKTLSESEVIHLAIDLCQGLTLLQGKGLVHGDIKPDNILVDDIARREPVFKLGDFSASHQEKVSDGFHPLYGAPAYMAPEIAEGAVLDARSDLYSLGLTLYRLMNENRLPLWPKHQIISREEQAAALRARLSGMELPPPCQASDRFAQVILRACAAKPEERFQSATEMISALRKLQSEKSTIPRWKKILAACAAVVPLAAGGWLWKCQSTPSSGKMQQEGVFQQKLPTLDRRASDFLSLWKNVWLPRAESGEILLPIRFVDLPFVLYPDEAPGLLIHEDDSGAVIYPEESLPDGWRISVGQGIPVTYTPCDFDPALGAWSTYASFDSVYLLRNADVSGVSVSIEYTRENGFRASYPVVEWIEGETEEDLTAFNCYGWGTSRGFGGGMIAVVAGGYTIYAEYDSAGGLTSYTFGWC